MAQIKIRVYYEDTDCGNVVYYANYLRYMERGRTELLRERGVNLSDYHNQGCLFVVADLQCKYHSSARYNDLLTVTTAIAQCTGASLTFTTEIINEQHRLLVSSTTRLACVSTNGTIQRVPKELIDKLL